MAGAAIALASTNAIAEDCANQFYAPNDYLSVRPLSRPHPDFSELLRAANAGNASSERSVAAAYEAGYLVAKCPAQAVYWYRKAASKGDDIASAWIANHDLLAKMQSAGECAGDSCPGMNKSGSRNTVFLVSRNGHYFAPVTINGITVEGLVDTGATTVAMSEDTAARLGIQHLPSDTGTSMTANGAISVRSLTVPRITVSGLELQRVKVSIGGTSPLLIGMSFLNRVKVRMESGALSISK